MIMQLMYSILYKKFNFFLCTIYYFLNKIAEIKGSFFIKLEGKY